jgi:hypothetical protein
MAEYSRIAKGSFVSTGGAKAINLPFLPDAVELFNFTASGTPAQFGVPFAYWDNAMGQGFASAQVFNGTPVLTSQNFTVGGISTFSAGLALQYGAQLQIVGITKAAAGVVTTSAAHGLTTGDVVVLTGLVQSPTTGMQQIASIPFAVTVLSPTTFSIPYNTNQSNFTALSGSPAGAFARKVLFPFLYAPGVSEISAITLGTTTTVVTTAPHNLVVGSEVAFRIPSAWGTIQLNSLPNVNIPGSPIYGYVISVTNSTTVVVNINSSAFTAFNSNPTFAATPGLTPPQILAVGDVNTGGLPIYLGSPLYPSPLVNGVPTINGPAIQGAFVNNTSAGFIIGNTAVSTAVLAGSVGDTIFWRAYLSDFAAP